MKTQLFKRQVIVKKTKEVRIIVKQVKPLYHKEDKKERIEDKKERGLSEPKERKYLIKQVKPLKREEDKKERVEYEPVKYKPIESGTNWNLICYLIIGLAVGIFLLAGGWQLVFLLFYVLGGGW